MKCLVGINHQTVTSNILYYANDISLYKQGKNLILYNSANEAISSSSAPVDCDRYEIIDLIDSLLVVFSGKTITVIDKAGGMHFSHNIDPIKVGRCITKPLLLDRERIVFGTKVKDRVQFVKYNFLSQSREAQSASWKVFGITAINLLEKKICGVLDSSLLVCCNAETCENIWSRFEAAKIQRGMLWYKDKILYTSQGTLKSVWINDMQNIVIPSIRFNSLEHLKGDILYATSKSGLGICAVDMTKQEILWETVTKSIIETYLIPVKIDNETTDCIVARTPDTVTIINASNGQMLQSVKVPTTTQMRFTGDFLVINQTAGTTIIGGK